MAVLYIRRYLGTALKATSRVSPKAGEGGEPVAQQTPAIQSPCLRGRRLELLGPRETSKLILAMAHGEELPS